MWNRIVADLGTVTAPFTATVIFHHTGVISNLIVKPSCGCTVPDWNETTNNLTLNVDIGRIPAHLKKEGFYLINKTISLEYTEEEKEKRIVLIIKALAK